MSDLTKTVEFALDDLDPTDAEAAAIKLVVKLAARFDWAGTYWTRQDVEEVADRDLTDEEWAQVTDTWDWNNAYSTVAESGVGTDIIMAALEAAGVDTV